MADKWHIIGKGYNGWHAAGVNVTSSGGNLEPYTYWTGKECDGYAREAIEGALVYDASEAPSEQYVAHVIKGPMLHPELKDEWVKFGHDDNVPHSLDYVGISFYESLLRSIPNVRFGRVREGVCHWE